MELKGIIQEKTDNSVKVNNFWIKFFNKELLDGLNSGDEVSLKYKDNSKDGKVYHNGIEIKKLTFNKVKLDTTTLNTLIMCSKDIVVKSMDIDTCLNFNLVFKELYDSVTKL